MSEEKIPFHYVTTLEEAKKLVADRDHFWVSNCGCREAKSVCKRSRIDLCLVFRNDVGFSGTNTKKVDREFVNGILQETYEKHLVSRSFRNEHDRTITDGICFCCDDCCEYFTKPEEICDKGAMIEQTDMNACTHCSICEDVCYFDARKIEDDLLTINRDQCYGCGLCRDVCPEDCIQMIPR